MQFITASLLATALSAQLTAAAPAANGTLIERDTIQASINWFTREDCNSPCVENGLCLQSPHIGMVPPSTAEWIGWSTGCFDRPSGAESISLSVNNGHKFSGVNQDCKTYDNKGYNKPDFRSWDMHVAKFGTGENNGWQQCNMFKAITAKDGGDIKAVVYHW